MDRSYAKIKVTANGPYEVSNVQDIRLYAIKPDEAGASEEYVPGQKFTADENPLHLCRCGRSGMRLFVTAVTKRRIGTERKQLLLSRY